MNLFTKSPSHAFSEQMDALPKNVPADAWESVETIMLLETVAQLLNVVGSNWRRRLCQRPVLYSRVNAALAALSAIQKSSPDATIDDHLHQAAPPPEIPFIYFPLEPQDFALADKVFLAAQQSPETYQLLETISELIDDFIGANWKKRLAQRRRLYRQVNVALNALFNIYDIPEPMVADHTDDATPPPKRTIRQTLANGFRRVLEALGKIGRPHPTPVLGY